MTMERILRSMAARLLLLLALLLGASTQGWALIMGYHSLKITNESLTLKVGESLKLTTELGDFGFGGFSGTNIAKSRDWTFSDASAFTAVKSGDGGGADKCKGTELTITALKPGTYTVKVKFIDKTDLSVESGLYTINVNLWPNSITWTGGSEFTVGDVIPVGKYSLGSVDAQGTAVPLPSSVYFTDMNGRTITKFETASDKYQFKVCDAGNGKWKDASVTVTVKVKKKPNSITWPTDYSKQTVYVKDAIDVSGAKATSGEALSFYRRQGTNDAKLTVTNGKITLDAAGTWTIVCKGDGTTTHLAPAEVVKTVTVKLRPNSITWDADAARTWYVGESVALNATANGCNVAYAIGETPLSGTTYTFDKARPYAITVSCPAGDGTYDKCDDVTKTFRVEQREQMLQWEVAPGRSFEVDDQLTSANLQAVAKANADGSGDPTNVAVIYSVDDQPVTLPYTFAQAGTYRLGATTVADDKWKTATLAKDAEGFDSYEVVVSKKQNVITWESVGESGHFTLTASSANGAEVSYAWSADPNAAPEAWQTLEAGKRFDVKGTYYFRASAAGDERKWLDGELVKSYDQGISRQTITYPELPAEVAVGTQLTFSASTNATEIANQIYYLVNGQRIEGNQYLFDHEGEYKIEAKSDGSADYGTAYWSGLVRAERNSQTLAWAGLRTELKVGEAIALDAQSSAELPVTYTVNGELVEGASYTFEAAGTHTVVATQAGNSYFAPATMRETVVVGKSTQSVTLTDLPLTAAVGQTVKPVLKSTQPGAELRVTYNGVTETIKEGSYMFDKAGTYVFEAVNEATAALQQAPAVYAEVVVTRKMQAIKWDDVPLRAAVGDKLTLPTKSTVGLAVTAQLGEGLTAEAIEGEEYQFAAPGTYRFTLSQEGNDEFEPAPEQIRVVNVLAAMQRIVWSGLKESYNVGEVFTFSAESSSERQVQYALTVNGSEQNIGESDLADGLTLLTEGVYTVRATASGDGKLWLSAPALEHTFRVSKADQSIEWEATPVSVLVGQPLELSASATSGLEVTFTVDGLPVSGSYTPQVAGSFQVVATQPGDGSYNAAASVLRVVTAYTSAPGGEKGLVGAAEGTSALGTVEAAVSRCGLIYDLAGHARGTDLTALPKGIYVQGGKLVRKN